jgi:hypothetical protein
MMDACSLPHAIIGEELLAHSVSHWPTHSMQAPKGTNLQL